MNHMAHGDAESEPPTLISIVGLVDEDGGLHLHPPFPLPADVELRAGRAEAEETEARRVALTEYDADGQVLYRYMLPMSTLCAYPDASGAINTVDVSVFTEVVLLPSECTRLNIATALGHEVEITRGTDEPVIRFEDGTPRVRGGSVHLRWSVDPESAAVIAMCTDQSGPRPLGLYVGASSLEFDLKHIEGPTATITLTASADLQFASIESSPFATGNEESLPQIVLPIDGNHSHQSEIDFFASVPSRLRNVDRQALEWSSSIDSVIGTGQYVRFELSPGNHEIVLSGRWRGADEPVEFSTIQLVVDGESAEEQGGSDASTFR